MRDLLKSETEKLARSWMHHEPGWLAQYLVAGVEDPRLNLQSILSRHFLVRAFCGEYFSNLMTQEYRFAAAMNWLLGLANRSGDQEELSAVLYALERGADNAEGLEIPLFMVQLFAELPLTAHGLAVPNYLDQFLSQAGPADHRPGRVEASLNTFQTLWHLALSPATFNPPALRSEPAPARPISLVEPACGSANDYRFIHAYGIARWLQYAGFDLCAKNVQNALGLFPGVRFEVGNVFEIRAPDKAFDLCLVQDLLEHLSLEGMQAAVREICRVTRRGLCVGFFQMDEIRDHVARPVDDYHWNLLSMTKMRELFAQQGFAAQVIHISTFLHQQVGCDQTHNPNAYTFLLRAQP